ncbi:MAG: PAS domain S-box protein [Nitrospiraceae bacterium]|nr:MAG: PAS domain S-box protein [Nitrospiraceae bacterium]
MTENSLKNSEVEYLHDIIDSMIDIVLIVDKKLHIIMVNKAAEKLLGYKSEHLIGKHYDFLCANREGCCENIKKIHEAGSLTNIETYYRTKNGSNVPVLLSVSPLRDNSGITVVVAKDNRDYQNAIELLAREHEKLNILFGKVEVAKKEWEMTMDCVGDMILLTDDDGTIKRINKAVIKFIGKQYHEILGEKWEDLIHELGFESCMFYSGGVELFHKPTEKWFVLSAYPFDSMDLGSSGTVLTLHETTEIKHITDQLEKTTKIIESDRSNLKEALQQISIMIDNVTKQQDFDISLSNPYLKKCYEVKNCTKKDCVCYGKEAMRCWQTAGTFCGGQIQGAFAQKYKNCSECEVFSLATKDPIYQIGEQFNNMMHVLEIKNRELAKAYAELKATQAQILQREKMASIGQLAAGVAHEINNPMGFISSNLGTLGKYIGKLTEFINAQSTIAESAGSAETAEKLKEIKKKLKLDYILEDVGQLISESLDGADRVKKIVQNLKSFSRVDEAEFKHTDINECIESTLNIVWNELKYKATMVKEYGEVPQIKCYPQQLNQVFMNLLVNAAHAIEKQGEIKIKTWNRDGSINISISDTGCGIPADKINRVFEPFYTTKPVGQGTGLGLSITYDIIKKHNGDINVESEVGKGTVFTVTIPVTEGK